MRRLRCINRYISVAMRPMQIKKNQKGEFLMDWLWRLKHWHFDWASGAFTTFLLPIGIYLATLIRKAIKEWSGYLVDGMLYTVGRVVHKNIAARVSLRRYCRLRNL
jgi:hypothetical protein